MSFTPPKRDDEREYFGFDFSQELAEGETISSATFSITVLEGTDEDAADMLSGSAVISDGDVTILVIGGVEDVRYNLHCLAFTSDGQRLHKNDDFWVRDADYGLVDA